MARDCVNTLFLGGMMLSLMLFNGCAPQTGVYQPAAAKLIESANILKQAGQTDAAICRLEAAADIAPELYQIQYNLGVLYSETNQYLPAIDHLNKGLEISPNEPNGLYTLAYSYQSLGDQYLSVSEAQNPEELADQNIPEAVRTISPDRARQKAAEEYQNALKTYEAFLKAAPSSDPGRKTAQEQVDYIQTRLQAIQSAADVND